MTVLCRVQRVERDGDRCSRARPRTRSLRAKNRHRVESVVTETGPQKKVVAIHADVRSWCRRSEPFESRLVRQRHAENVMPPWINVAPRVIRPLRVQIPRLYINVDVPDDAGLRRGRTISAQDRAELLRLKIDAALNTAVIESRNVSLPFAASISLAGQVLPAEG